MGEITVSFTGSFMPQPTKMFSAMHGGHAQAIAETIEWLSGQMLPKAIYLDHSLQSQGEIPEQGFGSIKMVETNKQQNKEVDDENKSQSR